MYGISMEEIVQKLVPIDIFILDELKDKSTPQLGINKNDLLNKLKSNNVDSSIFKVSQSLIRLEFVNCIATLKSSNTNLYYITENGLISLNILDNK